ncbi:restriction endonuclease subunit S [Rhodoferax sp. TBRC 17198]|uniref:restriction endonuclease subunit S n=1 Tax=Rhodoferax potami TaxID=3068338 RepID=UPI0028BD6ED3|nr:restriction endonuclease subunit S [Rhodoferax sp. TBRC 17198]MDT7522059.1 restriction endonuclease subunit S [Rhodoferax sp. TBRC 17198]
MTSEWELVEIGSFAKLRSGFAFKSADWQECGVPVIKIANIKNGRILAEGCGYVSSEVASKAKEWVTKQNDVLIAMTGYVGEVAQVQANENYLINQRVGRFEFYKNTVVDPKYFFYHLQLPVTRSEIEVMARGSAQPNLSAADAHKIKVSLPPLQVQLRISRLLSTFDERITLLRETNQTLETIAQALFKSWFVDFDPVRAKAEGRMPEGIDAATAALFPDAFEETKLGMVPKGWSAATLSTVATFQNGYAFKGSDWTEVGHPVVKIGNVKPLHIDFDGCSFVSPQTVAGLERFKLGAGDLLVGMTGYVGETGLVPQNDTASYLNQRVGRISTNNGLQDLGFVFSAVRQKEFKIYAESQSHGSAQANVSGADLMKFPVTVPSADILEKYNDLTHQFIASILNNHSVATSLTSLRDTLLPRLISGQLRIADAEAELEKATA